MADVSLVTKKKQKRRRLLFVVILCVCAAEVLLMVSIHWRSLAAEWLLQQDEISSRPVLGIKTHLEGFEAPQKAVPSRVLTTSPFEVSFVCNGCYHSPIPGRLTCGSLIAATMKTNNVSEWDALERVSRDHPLQCAKCDPKKCPTNQTKYWRYDHAAPTTSSPISHYISSIPARLRTPPMGNVTSFMNSQFKGKHVFPLYEYNPTLVQLPSSILDTLTFLDSQYDPVYMASFRVTTLNSCGGGYDLVNYWVDEVETKHQNYLGLVLLQADLSIIPGTDIVIDVEKQLFPVVDDIRGRQVYDFRLFAFDQTVYLHMQGDRVRVFIVPFTVIRGSSNNIPVGGIRLANLYGKGIEIILSHEPTSILGTDVNGKNFALFQGSGHGPNELLVELNPLKPHNVLKIKPEEINPLQPCELSGRMAEFYGKCGELNPRKRYLEIAAREALTIGNATSHVYVPDETFVTVDKIWFPREIFKASPHGGACCVRMDHPEANDRPNDDDDVLLVGVGHTKIPFRPWMSRLSPEQRLDIPGHQYASFFYAFEPTPPYKIRARSGLFCLPFPDKAEDSPNIYAHVVRERKLNLMREEFDCPKIHFASGIVDKAGDDSKVIVSYGVNDCIPRMVEIEKKEIARLLFHGLE